MHFAKVLKGVRLETTGQVIKERLNNPDGKPSCVSSVSSFSAAPQMPGRCPFRSALEGKAPDIQEMGWYQIHGTVDFEQINGQRIAIIRADQLDQVPEPDQQIAY